MENRDSRTLWVGNLHDNVTEEMLYELFLQTGPIEQVRRPKDRESQKLRNFAFITYKHACSVPYTLFVLDGVALFGRRLNIKNKTGSDQGNSKAQQNNDTYGLGLLPHPSYGKGVLPADLSDWVKDEPRQRQYERGMSGPPMMPGMGMPPGMMGMRPPMMGMPPMGPMMGPMMMGPRGPMPMMMMGPRGGGLNRSNTWHGDVGDLSRGSSRGGGSRDDRRSSRDDDDRRHRDRERKRDRSPPDNRRSDSSSGGRYEEKRGRYDDRDQRGGGRHGNSSGAGSSRGNHGNGVDVVNAQVQHLAQRQMQMLQQQQMHMMPGRQQQQQQQHDSRQNRRR